nr:hypothetical protein [uncultured Acetatifactor sp.]
MREKKQALKPDTVLKNYWSDNERFADFFNAVLFHGEQMIFPEELEELDTEESTVLEHREYAESITASRDSVKVRKKSSALGVEFVILGVGNQGYIHYAMLKLVPVITVVVHYGEKPGMEPLRYMRC